MNKVFLIFLWFLLIDGFGQSHDKNSASKKYEVIKRNDNDFVTYEDSVSRRELLPALIVPVVQKINNKNAIKNRNIIFKISYDAHISLFVIKAIKENWISYYLIAFDSVRKTVSNQSIEINGKWMEKNENGFNFKMLERPLIYFSDFDFGRVKVIVIKERAHNGNMYNAVISNYISIDENLNLRRIFCLESKYLSFIDPCTISRTLKENIIEVSQSCENQESEIIGRVSLNLNVPCKVLSKDARHPMYKDFLVTGSAVPDEFFMKSGYTFRY